jgi:hypothetical protein
MTEQGAPGKPAARARHMSWVTRLHVRARPLGALGSALKLYIDMVRNDLMTAEQTV